MTNKTLIFGHKNPDTDSIASAFVMENLEKNLGNENVEAVALGNPNKETQYALSYIGMENPRTIQVVENEQNVILVDHNETSQTVENIENANILKVIDHHTMNFSISHPIYYRAEPIGCTSSVLYKMYKEYELDITPAMATLMLSAIISDTLLFKSPICTKEDITIAQKLATIANIDISSYGMELLKAGTDISDFSPEQVINIDSKLFEKDGKKFKIAQINTADIDGVFTNQPYFEAAINDEIEKEKLDLYVFTVTDILNSNSKIISLGDSSPVVEKAFGVPLDNHTAMLENVVSRKKQILPNILNNLE